MRGVRGELRSEEGKDFRSRGHTLTIAGTDERIWFAGLLPGAVGSKPDPGHEEVEVAIKGGSLGKYAPSTLGHLILVTLGYSYNSVRMADGCDVILTGLV